jgi:hypothetical protein
MTIIPLICFVAMPWLLASVSLSGIITHYLKVVKVKGAVLEHHRKKS